MLSERSTGVFLFSMSSTSFLLADSFEAGRSSYQHIRPREYARVRVSYPFIGSSWLTKRAGLLGPGSLQEMISRLITISRSVHDEPVLFIVTDYGCGTVQACCI